MSSSRGMDRELRRTIALSRAFIRNMGSFSQQPVLTVEEATAAFAVVEDGLPFITHPIIPSSIAQRLHSAAQSAFKDFCRIAIENRGSQSLQALQALAVHTRSSWVKIYTRRVEEIVSACGQKMKMQKQIADAILDYAWQQETHPNFREIVKLARLTKRTVKQVTRWFENRRARYKNKPARGPSDMHEVLKNIAAMKKPALPIDAFEDESKPHRYRDNDLPAFLRSRVGPSGPLTTRLAPLLWPQPYGPLTRARTDALGPTVIPPSKTDPSQAPIEVTKHAFDELIVEVSRLTLRQRIEPRPTKKGKKDPKLALITIEPAPKTPVATDEPSSKPHRLYPRRRRASAKSKEAAAARLASASSTASQRSAPAASDLSLGVPSGCSATTASPGVDANSIASSLDTSSIDFNKLIAQLAADAHAAQLTPSTLDLLPTPDDLSTFFSDLGSAVDFHAPHQVTLESLSGSDPLFDQLFVAMPETVGSAVVPSPNDASYDLTQHPFDLSALVEFNSSLDAIELTPEPLGGVSLVSSPVIAGPTVHTPASSSSPVDPELADISNPRAAAALEQVLLLLDDPSVMEQLDEFTPEEQIQLLTELGMDLLKEELARSSKPKSKGEAAVESKKRSPTEPKGKGQPSAGKDKASVESKDATHAVPKTKTKAKRTKTPAVKAAAAQTSQDAMVDLPLPSDPNSFNAEMTFDPSLLQAAANMDFSPLAWPVPPTVSPTFPADPVFDPVQLVDMPFDPTQFDPAAFAAMQFDPTLLAAASFDSTHPANYAPADTVQPATSMPFDGPMPEFDFSQYVPEMQTAAPFDLVSQPAPFDLVSHPASFDFVPQLVPSSSATIEPQQTFAPDATSFDTAPLSYQQVPLSYQQASPLSYEQAPLSYQQAPLPYQQASPLSYQQVYPLSYEQAPLSYQQAPVSYQQTALPYQQVPLLYQHASLMSYQQPAPLNFDQQTYFNFDQQASYNFDYMASTSTPEQSMPTFIPDMYNPFLTPDWFCAPMATMLQMPLTA